MEETKFEFFEHTADVKFRAYGKTIEEQFSNAALAMFNIIMNTGAIEAVSKKKIEAEGKDEKALLYDWLEKLLVLIDTEEFMLKEVKNLKIEKKDDKFTLSADVSGDKYREKYELFGGIKAVTYNDMEISDKFVQVVCDI